MSWGGDRRQGRTAALAAVVAVAIAGCSGAGGDKPSSTNVPPTTKPPTPTTTPPPASSSPFATELRFMNDTAAPLFLFKGCIGVDFGISSAASGFRDRLGPKYACACNCEDASCGGPLSCGACPTPVAVTVNSGDAVAVPWDGVLTTFDEKARGDGLPATFSCVHSTALSAGAYRVAVRVFADADAAAARIGGRVVTRDFALPTDNGVLEVPLGAAAADGCDPTPDAATPVCTGAEAHDVPCSLGQSLGFAWEGGLSLYVDSSGLLAPVSYQRQRMSADPNHPAMTCTTPVPRCTRDSRVVTTSDVARVVNEPTVAAAFAANTPVYGVDTRGGDGAILILRRPDGTSLGIGDPCSGCGPVQRPLTPGMLAVVPVLRDLDVQMMSAQACIAFRPPGSVF